MGKMLNTLFAHMHAILEQYARPFLKHWAMLRSILICVHACTYRATIEEAYNKLQTDIQTEIVDHKEKMNSFVSLKEEKEKESDIILQTVRQ